MRIRERARPPPRFRWSGAWIVCLNRARPEGFAAACSAAVSPVPCTRRGGGGVDLAGQQVGACGRDRALLVGVVDGEHVLDVRRAADDHLDPSGCPDRRGHVSSRTDRVHNGTTTDHVQLGADVPGLALTPGGPELHRSGVGPPVRLVHMNVTCEEPDAG